MITVDKKELGRMQEKDLAVFYEGLCSVRFPEKKARGEMAGFLGVGEKTFDKIKQGKAHAPIVGWIVASYRLDTTLWFDWVDVQKEKHK